MDEAALRTRSDVETYGWHVAKIAGDDQAPPWAFSIGLEHNFDHPEVLVFGMELPLLHNLINHIGEQVKRGQRFDPRGTEDDDGYRPQGVLAHHPPALRRVQPRWYGPFVGNAAVFYRERPFRVLQCFWPDAQGCLPWEQGFAPEWHGRQPLLYLDDEAAALGPELAQVLRAEGAL